MAIAVEHVTKLKGGDLEDLCTATEVAIRDGIGFNWLTPPSTDVLESYWRGVLVVPERTLFVGRLDGVIAGSVQLLKPGPTKQSTAFSCTIENHFVAPWARGHGLARALLSAAEEEARAEEFSVIRLSVRETQDAAINLYKAAGYAEWGVLAKYEELGGRFVAGHFFAKDIA